MEQKIMTKSIYIAGPMTGIAMFNFPAFFNAEKQLFHEGWRVFNPAQNEPYQAKSYQNLPFISSGKIHYAVKL